MSIASSHTQMSTAFRDTVTNHCPVPPIGFGGDGGCLVVRVFVVLICFLLSGEEPSSLSTMGIKR